jgi:hypothetical protein
MFRMKGRKAKIDRSLFGFVCLVSRAFNTSIHRFEIRRMWEVVGDVVVQLRVNGQHNVRIEESC